MTDHEAFEAAADELTPWFKETLVKDEGLADAYFDNFIAGRNERYSEGSGVTMIVLGVIFLAIVAAILVVLL